LEPRTSSSRAAPATSTRRWNWLDPVARAASRAAGERGRGDTHRRDHDGDEAADQSSAPPSARAGRHVVFHPSVPPDHGGHQRVVPAARQVATGAPK
jgi:hypothetical protein